MSKPTLPPHYGERYTRMTELAAHYARLRNSPWEKNLVWLLKGSELINCLWVVVIVVFFF